MYSFKYIWIIVISVHLLILYNQYMQLHPVQISRKMANFSNLRSKSPPIVQKRFPQAIIIGAKKCSTDAIRFMISEHPNVVAGGHEVHFFEQEQLYHLGLEWYRQQFPESTQDQVTIEKTPAYFIKKEALERIHFMNSSIKLVLSVRDPTERVISDYVHCLDVQPDVIIGKGTFGEQILDSKGEVDPHKYIINPSLYHIHMKNVLTLFKRHQILVVDGKLMSINPLSVLKRIEKFLHIPQWYNSERLYYNETKGFYCINNNKNIDCLAKSKGREHPLLDNHAIIKLRRFFAPHNEIFYNLVGHDFGWPKI